MTVTVPDDIRDMVRDQLATGEYRDESDVLRAALKALADQSEDLQALRTAIADWRAGDAGVPLDEAFDELRQRNATRTAS
jgi:putative addiction module CopG family antidote